MEKQENRLNILKCDQLNDSNRTHGRIYLISGANDELVSLMRQVQISWWSSQRSFFLPGSSCNSLLSHLLISNQQQSICQMWYERGRQLIQKMQNSLIFKKIKVFCLLLFLYAPKCLNFQHWKSHSGLGISVLVIKQCLLNFSVQLHVGNF